MSESKRAVSGEGHSPTTKQDQLGGFDLKTDLTANAALPASPQPRPRAAARAALALADKLAARQPPAPGGPSAPTSWGEWKLVQSTGFRRILAQCSRCGATRQFGWDAFQEGSITPCDCNRHRSAGAAIPAPTFAANVAALEGGEATYRKKARR